MARNSIMSILLALLSGTPALAQTSLFGGTQANFLPTNTPAACLTAFNTTLNCSPTVQLLNTQNDRVGWNQSNLTSLCKLTCYSSLVSLRSSAASACSTWSPVFNGGTTNASQILDFYIFKYNQTCLTDGSTFCLLKETSWNISAMSATGSATWPTHTNKTYPDWNLDNPVSGTNQVVDNTTTIQPWQTPPPTPQYSYNGPAALDYFYTGGPKLSANLGWNTTLEYDEYPTQIQCSACWIDRFRLSFATQWGEPYNEVTAQIWSNIKQNCAITTTLIVHPTLNISGPPLTGPFIQWNSLPTCGQNITYQSSRLPVTLNTTMFAMTYNVTTSGMLYLNPSIAYSSIRNGTYCLPLSCDVMRVSSSMSAIQFLLSTASLADTTLTQFSAWNPNVVLSTLLQDDVVCIGPPGGAYTPTSGVVAPAYPSVYTTTAKAAEPAPSGTIPNCGKYYGVQSGDYCNTIALNYSLTFSQLIDMNPSLDSACSNLLAGYDYCVSPVNGTNVAHQTTTRGPASVTSTSTPTTSSTLTPIATTAAPAPTISGTTTSCRLWYTVQSGDSCYGIEQTYSITFAQLQKWNPALDTACDNLWGGYAYCVAGP